MPEPPRRAGGSPPRDRARHFLRSLGELGLARRPWPWTKRNVGATRSGQEPLAGFLHRIDERPLVNGPQGTRLVAALQVFGATVLLWATLFVPRLGHPEWGGVTLTERVNRWIYRLLYCLGTAAVVASLALP